MIRDVEEALKPCPHCGGLDLAYMVLTRDIWRVICRTCDSSGGSGDEDVAREKWNTRAMPDDRD
jgi:Lar family restriction alleviation protein